MPCTQNIGYISIATPIETAAYDDTHKALKDLAIRLRIKAEAAIDKNDIVDENGTKIEWACKGGCKDKGGVCKPSVEIPLWAATLEVVRYNKKFGFRYRISMASGGAEVSLQIRCACVPKQLKTSAKASNVVKAIKKSAAKKKAVKKKSAPCKAKKASGKSRTA